MALASTDLVLKKVSDLMPALLERGHRPVRHRLERMQAPDRIGVGDLAFVEQSLAGEMISQHQGDFERRHRAFVRCVDVDDDLAAFERGERVAHLARAFEVVEPVSALGHAGDIVRADAGPGGDDQEVVGVGLAQLRDDRLLVDVDVLGRVDDVGNAAVQHLALVAEKLGFTHLAERHVQQTGLVHVLVGRADHGDGHAARGKLLAQLPAQSVGDDGAGETASDDENLLGHYCLLPFRRRPFGQALFVIWLCAPQYSSSRLAA